jgi:hypothetical protein
VTGGQLTPLSRPQFTQTHPVKNFEIAILFKVVDRSGNYVFEDDRPLTALRTRVVSYALGAYKVFIESVVVGTSKTRLIQLKIKRASALFNIRK